jgi:uncharacterized phage-associated protein
MSIRFQFNLGRAVQAMAYLLERIGATDKVKLMKLMYLADRAHYIDFGYPITGDRLVAMPLGPVPSTTLNALNGEIAGSQDRVFPFLHLDDVRVSLRKSPGTDQLGDSERAALDRVVQEHGAKDTWRLVRETHKLPEYVECYVEGTSRPIAYERIARVSGSDARYRKNRPVISREGAARMACPFPAGDDL